MFQQQLLECDTIPTAIPVQDTTSHMISHDSFQQPLQNNMYSSGEMLQPISVGQLEIKHRRALQILVQNWLLTHIKSRAI